MSNEEMTATDKARILGYRDRDNAEDFDRDFYETMHRTRTLGIDDVDDHVRRAVLRYLADSRNDEVRANGAWIMMGFFHGYQVGRKLKRKITRG